MALAPKKAFVEQMQGELARAEGVLFVDFFKLTVAQVDQFRRSLRESKTQYRVVKNTLMRRVLAGTPFEGASSYLRGTPTGMVWGHEDPVTPAKLTFAFAKDCENLKVKGGIVDGQAIDAVQAKALSDLPSRTELQGSVIALAQSPGGKIQSTLKQPAGRIVGAIDALIERLEQAG